MAGIPVNRLQPVIFFYKNAINASYVRILAQLDDFCPFLFYAGITGMFLPVCFTLGSDPPTLATNRKV